MILLLAGCSEPDPAVAEDTGPIEVHGDLIAEERIVCEDPSLRESEGPLYRYEADEAWTHQVVEGERRDSPGLAVGDITGDGRFEIVLTNKNTSFVFRLEADGTMTDLTDAILPTREGRGFWGGTLADFDGDGDVDLFGQAIGSFNRLYRNEGGTLQDITASTVFFGVEYSSKGSAWGDMDLDGDLDLVVSNETSTYDDDGYDPPGDGPPNQVYENLGNSTFKLREDLLSHKASHSYTFLTAWLDLDGDLDPDMYSVNAFGHTMWGNRLLENTLEDGELGFEDVSRDAAVFQDMDGMGLGIGDLNGDERMDLLVTDWGRLWLFESAGPMSWYETTTARGLGLSDRDDRVVAWGSELVDLDNDTDMDAVVLFGQSLRRAAQAEEGQGQANPEFQPDGLWIQDEEGLFELAADEWDFSDELGAGRGFSSVDLNDDGYPDIVKRMVDEPATLHLSRCGENHWLKVRLAHPAPNTQAIGARVRIVVDGVPQNRWVVAGGTSLGYGGPNEVQFGLGATEVVESLEVFWPDGAVTSFDDVEGDRRVWVAREGASIPGMP